ncbi:hypothetical protein [Streptomyces sp. JNUCC 63]
MDEIKDRQTAHLYAENRGKKGRIASMVSQPRVTTMSLQRALDAHALS